MEEKLIGMPDWWREMQSFNCKCVVISAAKLLKQREMDSDIYEVKCQGSNVSVTNF